MLLQRASAGSGKTYKLAKTYIRLYISALDPESGLYILRPRAELRESHSHILGVTFTNKATAEMKDRIVRYLADLAAPQPPRGKEPAGWKAPAYLLDFTGENPLAGDRDDIIYSAETGKRVTRSEVQKSCSEALRHLLCDYGHFNISTIDTFFQSILRSFAYELRLGDNYRVELNDKFLAQVGVDQTLSSVNDTDAPIPERREMAEYVARWAGASIQSAIKGGERWDPFAKGDTGTYASMLSLAKMMGRESFKVRLDALHRYFADPQSFDRFIAACRTASGEVTELFRALRRAERNLHSAVAACNGGNAFGAYSGMATVWKNLASQRPMKAMKGDTVNAKMRPYVEDPSLPPPAKNNFLVKTAGGLTDPSLGRLFADFCRALSAWDKARAYWTTVMGRLHYMGMLHYVDLSRREFLTRNNTIPLSATGDILHGIIDREEVPFIYERIGTRLDHYLLDEFQDTSLLQWANLRPLLEQGMAYGNESLIIGDAKQSIYRFRNAEPDIIVRRVTAELPGTRIVPSSSPTPAEIMTAGTNHRSAREVVRANNTIFSLLPPYFDDAARPYLTPLYEGVVQEIARKETPGYVNISFNTPLGGDLPGAPDKPSTFSALPLLIADARARGYSFSDMAVLVNLKSDGRAAIDAIMAYNDENAGSEGFEPIELLSDEALQVADSEAVQVVLSVLSLVASGMNPGEEKRYIDKPELSQLVAAYRCYTATHPGANIDTVMRMSVEELMPASDIASLLEQASAATLPALVEAIIARYGTSFGAGQTPYLAAFQDTVIEYCDNYSADVYSFLRWWENNSAEISIPAPEGIDAVRVLTIHKSKGLEYPVVFIPKADWSLAPTTRDMARELIWTSAVPHNLPGLNAADVPPFIPVTPDGNMASPSSPFHADYEEYARDYAVDQLNKTYVAFTRAAVELHVYAKTYKNSDLPLIGQCLRNALGAISSLPASNLHVTGGDYSFSSEQGLVMGSPTIKQNDTDNSSPDIVHVDKLSPRNIDRDIIEIGPYCASNDSPIIFAGLE